MGVIPGIVAGVILLLIGVIKYVVTPRPEVDAGMEFELKKEAGKWSVKFDKSDILALAFVVFLFWGVAQGKIDAQSAFGTFAGLLAGAGGKEILDYLTAQKSKPQ